MVKEVQELPDFNSVGHVVYFLWLKDKTLGNIKELNQYYQECLRLCQSDFCRLWNSFESFQWHSICLW